VRSTKLITAAAVLLASSAQAAPSDLRRGQPKPHDQRCDGVTIPAHAGGLPFGVGEELGYDLTFHGVRVGKLEMKVGKPRKVAGRRVMTLFGRARTNTLVAQYQPFAGRYMSFIDPSSLHPVAVQVESTYGEDRRWERAMFAKDVLGLETDFRLKGRALKRSYRPREAQLFDLLTLLYYARTRAISPGAAVCNEIYAARRLWRMDAKVVGHETLSTPVGDKRVFVVDTSFDRVPHKDFDPRRRRPHIDVRVYFADDETRAPLAFEVDNGQIKGRGDLVRWSIRGSTGDNEWEF